jgi:hypothetical protein
VGPEVGENLGLRYLASALSQAGFPCEILAFNSQRDYPRILRSLVGSYPQPFLIGLSLQYNYALADQAVERVFHIFMGCLGPRNFGEDSPVVRLWLLRFDVEACRFFHPTVFQEEWRSRAVATTRRMSLHTAATLQTIVDHAQAPTSHAEDEAFAADLEKRCRALDARILVEADELAVEMSSAVGRSASLCEVRRFAENPIELSSSDWARLGVPRLQKGIEP